MKDDNVVEGNDTPQDIVEITSDPISINKPVKSWEGYLSWQNQLNILPTYLNYQKLEKKENH